MDSRKKSGLCIIIFGAIMLVTGSIGTASSSSDVFIFFLLTGLLLMIGGVIVMLTRSKKSRYDSANERMASDIARNMELAREYERNNKR